MGRCPGRAHLQAALAQLMVSERMSTADVAAEARVDIDDVRCVLSGSCRLVFGPALERLIAYLYERVGAVLDATADVDEALFVSEGMPEVPITGRALLGT